MAERLIYPIGEQDFKSLRGDGCVYVDKTGYIARLLADKNKYYFLARPRRFGKSLFLSTLRYFFEGERELFKGLYIDSCGWDWAKYPVLHLDLNSGEYTTPDNLDIVVDNMLRRWEKAYDVEVFTGDLTTRFQRIIETAHEKTGRQVVILVDEYDKPLVKNLNNREFELYREKLTALYSNFKTSAEAIRLVMLTGVSRFSKLSVFSGLNNLKDITFSDDFADICGITDDELTAYFKSGISELANANEITYEEACDDLKRNYDGYRFAVRGSWIFNPWSLLNCLSARTIANYWNETGIPTLIVESLKKRKLNLEKYLDSYCKVDDLKGFDLLNPDGLALMYQTGYLTIKEYNRKLRKVRLGIPNNEVKEGFFSLLLPYYVDVVGNTPKGIVSNMSDSLILGNPEKFMQDLQTFFAGIPYPMKIENENNFHNAFYLLMSLIGIDVDTEVMTSDGRIDLTMKTGDYIYIVELKYDHTARQALDQIEEKQYALKFSNDHRRIYRIGAAFSSRTRRIDDWIIEG